MLLAILGAFGFLQAVLVLAGGPGFEMKVMVSFGLVAGMVLAFADIILFGEPGRKRALGAGVCAAVALLVAILGWPGEGGPLLLALLAGFLACYFLIKKDRFVLYRWLFSGLSSGLRWASCAGFRACGVSRRRSSASLCW
jgi:asparagine N-glycosylation enzyme membrane subunit Stt3